VIEPQAPVGEQLVSWWIERASGRRGSPQATPVRWAAPILNEVKDMSLSVREAREGFL